MIDGVRPYSTYKDSGSHWLGAVPEHWGVHRLGTLGVFSASGIDKATVDGEPLVRLINYLDIFRNPTGELRQGRNFTTVSCPAWKCRIHEARRGDMFFTPSSETIDDIGWSAVAAEDLVGTVYSYHVTRFRPTRDLDVGFQKYWCNNTSARRQFSQACNGTTRKILTRGDFRNVVVALPPLAEQSSIARFLDHVERRVRHYIAAKRKLIALLNEQKQATIHRAVTRGLDANVRLKPSGVEWLGDVPEHWTITPNKAVMALRRRTVGTRSKDLTLLSLTLRGIVPRDLENPAGKFPADFGSYQIVEPGELVFCLFDMDETPRTVGIAHELGMVTGAYSVFTCIDQDVADFLYDVYLAMDAQKRLRPFYTGLRKVIQHGTFLGIKVAFPPTAELREIVSYVATEVARIDGAIARTEREVDLVREYRTRLIADVVTGKLDVREAAARLPDEVAEPELLTDADALAKGDESENEADLGDEAVEVDG